MHASVFAWVGEQVARHALGARNVLEVGSRIINGSIRPHFVQDHYFGVDMVAGQGVDRVVDETRLPFGSSTFEVACAVEMLEHARFPAVVLSEIRRVLVPGGVLLLTTRSEGFPEHSPPDYWRFSSAELARLCRWAGFERLEVIDDPQVGHPGVFVLGYKESVAAENPTRP